MASDRIETLQALLAKNSNDSRLLFGLALEYEKSNQWDDVIRTLRTYLSHADDEGNAWGRLGHALREAGLETDARAAYQSGIAAAQTHGHPSMAADFEEILSDWD